MLAAATYDGPPTAHRMPAGQDPLPTPATARTRAWVLPALLVLLVLVRGVSIVGLADVFYYGEELARGTAAKAIVDALPVAHHKIGHWYFEGGAFAVSHVTALLFLWLGPCILAHKLAALAVALGILTATYVLARKSFGEPTAILAGLFVVFAPESFHRLSYLNLGNHFAATLFLALILWLSFRIAFDGRTSLRAFCALALVSGLAFYFSFQSAPAIAFAAGLVLATRWRSLTPGKVAAALVALAIGLAPFLWMWSHVGREVFRVHDGYLFQSKPRSPDAPGALDFVVSLYAGRDAWDKVHVAVLQLAPIAGLVVFLVQRARFQRRESAHYVALFAYLGFFTIVYLKSGFTVGAFYHFFTLNRMSPYWLVGTVLTAATVVHLVHSPEKIARAAGLALGSFLLVSGVRDASRVWRETRFESVSASADVLLETKGYSYAEYLPYFRRHLDEPLEEQMRLVLSFREPARDWLVIEAVQSLIPTAELNPQQLTVLFQRLDSRRWRDFLKGLGPYLFADGGSTIEGALDRIAILKESDRAWRLAALGRTGPGPYRSTANGVLPPGFEREVALVLPRLSAVDRAHYFGGMGSRLHRHFQLYPLEAEAAIARQPPEIQDALRRGYVEAREWNRLP